MLPPILVNFGPLPAQRQFASVRTEARPLYRSDTSAGVRYLRVSDPSYG